MADFIKTHQIFYQLCGLLIAAAISVSVFIPQLDISLWVNGNYHIFIDYITYYGTYLGDGIFAILFSVALMMYNKRLGITVLLAYIFSSLTTQTLKHFVFNEYHRPFYFANAKTVFHQVLNTELHYHNSFPSGHTTTAFTIFGLLAFYTRKYFIYIAIACFVAYTRIYLFQHFLKDTIAGAVIGIIAATICYYYFFYRLKADFIINLLKKK